MHSVEQAVLATKPFYIKWHGLVRENQPNILSHSIAETSAILAARHIDLAALSGLFLGVF